MERSAPLEHHVEDNCQYHHDTDVAFKRLGIGAAEGEGAKASYEDDCENESNHI